MNTRTNAVQAASARLAGVRGRAGTAAPKRHEDRQAAYRAQTGAPALTPAQQRRARKKLNRAGR